MTAADFDREWAAVPLPDEPINDDDRASDPPTSESSAWSDLKSDQDQTARNGHGPPGVDDERQGYEKAVEYRLRVLRVNQEARRQLDDEIRPQIILPPLKSLTTLLDEPETPTQYRIAPVQPTASRVLFSAQQKVGKTTAVGNGIRALVDSELFLGQFTINVPSEQLVLLDDELSEDMLRRWLRAQNIRNTDAVTTVSLRGRVRAFDLLDDRTRAAWAQRFRDIGCDYLILDCLRPVLDALGLDESRDAGRFLVAFDALLAEAGISDALLVHHMGHNNERARGDSRLQDWPDAIWRLVRDSDTPGAPRYFSAYGRDVNVPEGRLNYDPSTRRLTYAAGSRVDTKTEAACVAVIKLLASHSGESMSKNAIESELVDEHTQKAIRTAIAKTVENGIVSIEDGQRGAKLHRIAHPCEDCGMPVTAGQQRHESCPQSGPEGLF